MNKKIFGVAFAMATSLIAQQAIAAEGGTVYYGLNSEPPSLNTIVNAGTASRTVRLAIHRGLFNYAADGSISNELAENYEISPDARTYTFHLRDAKFHDGSPVTANDVKATLEWITLDGGKATYRTELSNIGSIDTPDEKTVVIVVKEPFIPFLHYLALPESAILPAAWIKANYGDPNAVPDIGAGPFKLVNWERGREIVVEKFPEYYKEGLPHLDSVHYQFFSNEDTRTNALKSGEADLVDYMPWKDMASIDASSDLHTQCTTGPFMALQFNTSVEPFSKPEVRQAIAYAIDRQAVINAGFEGVGTPIFGLPIPEGYLGYSDEMANYFSYDPEKAKQMLADAGYPDGFEARLLSTSEFAFHQATGVVVQAELAKIGIKVELDLPDWAGRLSKAGTGDYDFMVSGTAGDISDPDWLTNFYYGGDQLVRLNNSPGFNDPQINELLDKGRVTLDPVEREEIYKQFVDRALELSPIDALMWRAQCYGVNNRVKNFEVLPGFLSFQSGISIENVEVN